MVNRGDGGFNRTASIVYVNNVNIQERLLSAGLAWYYPQYASKCGDFMELKRAEQSARDRGAGLWNSANPIAPWHGGKEYDEKLTNLNRLGFLPLKILAIPPQSPRQ
ncbi:thermonuclease family protein [Microcystis aeruginosa]|uniref:thermonuclease family protein n=1 Tax=Microcystis aeruginosa TaxID=1126 RepID=UPI0034D3498E